MGAAPPSNWLSCGTNPRHPFTPQNPGCQSAIGSIKACFAAQRGICPRGRRLGTAAGCDAMHAWAPRGFCSGWPAHHRPHQTPMTWSGRRALTGTFCTHSTHARRENTVVRGTPPLPHHKQPVRAWLRGYRGIHSGRNPPRRRCPWAIEARWGSTKLAFAGQLQPQQLNVPGRARRPRGTPA
jgi:hypothetical protein